MDKVIVKLYVPMIEAEYDVKLPVNQKLYQVIYLLMKAVYNLSDNYYLPSESPELYEKWTACKYDKNLTIQENGIKNGAELILI